MNRPSSEQVEVVLDFMEKNLDLARGVVAKTNGGKTKQAQKWVALTNMLNSLNGCTKDVKGWRKYWTDRKLKIYKKRHQRKKWKKIGAKLGKEITFNSTEKKIISLLGEESGDPLQNEAVDPLFELEEKPPTLILSNMNNTIKPETPDIEQDITMTDFIPLSSDAESTRSSEEEHIPSKRKCNLKKMPVTKINKTAADKDTDKHTTIEKNQVTEHKMAELGKEIANSVKDMTDTIKINMEHQNKLMTFQIKALKAFTNTCNELTQAISSFNSSKI